MERRSVRVLVQGHARQSWRTSSVRALHYDHGHGLTLESAKKKAKTSAPRGGGGSASDGRGGRGAGERSGGKRGRGSSGRGRGAFVDAFSGFGSILSLQSLRQRWLLLIDCLQSRKLL
eukprot:1964672-Pleurochrysis_carterae.AAC.1